MNINGRMTKRFNHVKATIARVICAFSFLLLLGIVGGMEREFCSMGAGIMAAALTLIVSVVAGLKGGIFK